MRVLPYMVLLFFINCVRLIDFNAIGCRAGISGVPFFEIYLSDKPGRNQQFSGAQPIDTFVSVLSRASVRAKV